MTKAASFGIAPAFPISLGTSVGVAETDQSPAAEEPGCAVAIENEILEPTLQFGTCAAARASPPAGEKYILSAAPVQKSRPSEAHIKTVSKRLEAGAGIHCLQPRRSAMASFSLIEARDPFACQCRGPGFRRP